MKKTMLKKEDWGGLTIVALLSTFLFPPYFIQLMTMAALTEFAHLWTTRLSRKEEDRLVSFEKEFRVAYKLEKAGKTREALDLYRKLEKVYTGDPRIAKLATLQIKKLTGRDGRKGGKKDAARKAGRP
jgi:hypothetical protein